VSAAPQVRLQRGLTLYAQGNTLGALWAFSEGIDLEPNNPLGHYLCGLAFQALGHGQEARAEWETVLALTVEATGSGREAPPSAETRWVRGLVQRLLAGGSVDAEVRPTAKGVPAMDDVPQIGTEGTGAGMRSQEELETAIRDAVQRHGGCYITDRSLADILMVTTEEQVVGWQQSFSAREALACHPHRQPIRQGSHHQECRDQEGRSDGVVFKRGEAPKARETASV
jgi:hypothetical protein